MSPVRKNIRRVVRKKILTLASNSVSRCAYEYIREVRKKKKRNAEKEWSKMSREDDPVSSSKPLSVTNSLVYS